MSTTATTHLPAQRGPHTDPNIDTARALRDITDLLSIAQDYLASGAAGPEAAEQAGQRDHVRYTPAALMREFRSGQPSEGVQLAHVVDACVALMTAVTGNR